MSGIGGIGANRYNYNQYRTQNDQQKHMRNASSGKKINQASDGAAEMAIAKKLANTAKGLEVGRQNLQAGRSALYIADGGMDGINDYMQRMRELSIRANNGLMGDDERQAIQDETDQLKAGINDASRQAQYNEKSLLTEDGSVTLLTSNEPATMEVNTAAVDAASLGITDSVTKLDNFDLDSIDKAMDKLSTARSIAGAQTNAVDHTINYNNITAENTTASQSRLEDADIAEEMIAVNKNKTLTTAQIMMQKRQEEDEQTKNAALFA
ncbi:MAG: flagellin [Lachnospiraceae bacterium]|jgi:flagellin|nr:flagellin [Lachnospiraceae bacterium]